MLFRSSSCGVTAFELPLITVLMEFKPSPFSPFSLVPVAVFNFPLSLQLLLGRGAFPVLSPLSPSSLHLQKPLPVLRSFTLPRFTSPRHMPAEFCSSGCVDCCVNPLISFLGVQDGLVLVWLCFMDARHTKTSLLFRHLGFSPHDLMAFGIKPCIGLFTGSMEPAMDSLSLAFCSYPTCAPVSLKKTKSKQTKNPSRPVLCNRAFCNYGRMLHFCAISNSSC